MSPESHESHEALRVKTILIVEDDPINGLVLFEYLQANGYRCLLAKNGLMGVEVFKKRAPDLVLVDVLLPYKNGFEVCFDIKRTEHGKETPVLLMSAVYKDKVHAEKYGRDDLGAAGFIAKPFELVDLLGRVRALIGEN